MVYREEGERIESGQVKRREGKKEDEGVRKGLNKEHTNMSKGSLRKKCRSLLSFLLVLILVTGTITVRSDAQNVYHTEDYVLYLQSND